MAVIVKICLTLLFIGVAIGQTPLTTEDAAKIKAKVVTDCRDKSKDLTDEEMDDILNKRIGSKTKSGDCFMACVLKGCNYMALNNTMLEKNLRDRLDRTKDQAPPEEYPKKIKILDICKAKEVPEKDECEAAKKFVFCVLGQRKELGVTTRLW